MTEPKASERRDGPRIDLRLRVRYATSGTGAAGADGAVVPAVDGEAEASDVSPKGLRLESDKPVPAGSELKLHVDAGEEEELQAIGYVTWCKPHTTPTGKTIYDLGVRFESDWLARDRGPLGSALARIFAMNNFEPARNYERTPISLRAQTSSGVSAPAVDLVVGNLSIGGMQLRSTADLGDQVKTGDVVKVEVELKGKVHTLDGRVAWTAASRGTEGPRVADSFGIEFKALPDEDRALLEAMRVGNTEPTRITVLLG